MHGDVCIALWRRDSCIDLDSPLAFGFDLEKLRTWPGRRCEKVWEVIPVNRHCPA